MKARIFTIAVSALIAGNAYSAGFEKSIMWSGRSVGYGGAAVSVVEGSEGIYFNPAGLAAGKQGDVSLNYSPTWITFNAPIASPSAREDSDHNYNTLGGFTASYKLNEKIGLGVGAYAAGGEHAVYDNVDLSADSPNVTFRPTIESKLRIVEYALGGAYAVTPNLRVGAAWRILHASGSLSTVKKTVNNTAYTFVNVTDAKQTKYNGFRLGVEYQEPKWGVGAAFRNETNFSAVGQSSGAVTVIPTNTTTAAVGSETTLGLTFPMAVTAGGNYLLWDDLRLLGAIDFVQYSQDEELQFTGTLNGTALPNIPLHWSDMWNFRVGGEFTGLRSVVLRAGYILTTKVTSESDARGTIAPPGVGHTFTVGAGTPMNEKWELNGALEYAVNNATGQMTATPAAATTKELIPGTDIEYRAHSVGIHTGVTYRF